MSVFVDVVVVLVVSVLSSELASFSTNASSCSSSPMQGNDAMDISSSSSLTNDDMFLDSLWDGE